MFMFCVSKMQYRSPHVCGPQVRARSQVLPISVAWARTVPVSAIPSAVANESTVSSSISSFSFFIAISIFKDVGGAVRSGAGAALWGVAAEALAGATGVVGQIHRVVLRGAAHAAERAVVGGAGRRDRAAGATRSGAPAVRAVALDHAVGVAAG